MSLKKGCEGMTSKTHNCNIEITSILLQYNVRERTMFIPFIHCYELLLFSSVKTEPNAVK